MWVALSCQHGLCLTQEIGSRKTVRNLPDTGDSDLISALGDQHPLSMMYPQKWIFSPVVTYRDNVTCGV